MKRGREFGQQVNKILDLDTPTPCSGNDNTSVWVPFIGKFNICRY